MKKSRAIFLSVFLFGFVMCLLIVTARDIDNIIVEVVLCFPIILSCMFAIINAEIKLIKLSVMGDIFDLWENNHDADKSILEVSKKIRESK